MLELVDVVNVESVENAVVVDLAAG